MTRLRLKLAPGYWVIRRVPCSHINSRWPLADAFYVCYLNYPLFSLLILVAFLAAVNHRKALTPSTAFPAQLLDLTAGFAYLLARGFTPENIVLIGDSSGGHLLLALSRYLSELDRVDPSLKVGMPGAMLLISVSVEFCFVLSPFQKIV